MLTSIQQEIENIYQIKCSFSVDDFLLDEKERSKYSKKFSWLNNSDETLLIRQNENSIDVGLLLDPKLLDWSRNLNWREIKNPIGTNDCSPSKLFNKLGSLVEGVSHFVYFLWKAEREQSLTQLELELQAEIDKFLLFSQTIHPKHLGNLIDSLYEESEWIPTLSPEEKSRYETSAKLAFKYCHHLRKTYFHSDQTHAIYSEIRAFYRMSQTEKIHWIEN